MKISKSIEHPWRDEIVALKWDLGAGKTIRDQKYCWVRNGPSRTSIYWI